LTLLALSATLLLSTSQASSAGQSGTTSPAVRERINRVGADLFSAAPHPVEAVTELKSILALEPGSAEAHMLLGIAYGVQKKSDLMGEAVAELRQALALNPALGMARLSLARIYLDMARPARARDELNLALEQAPNQPAVMSLLGEAERQLGNGGRAIELHRQALQADASFVQARYYLGLALLDSGKTADAVLELQAVVKSGANPAESNLALGTAYLAAGRTTDAIAALRESARLDPARPETHIHLARAYRARGLLADAARELKLATPGDQSMTGLYTNVQLDIYMEEGLVSLKQGKLEEAAAAFEKVLALDSGHAAARQQLAAVKKRLQDRARLKKPAGGV
jgi:tetratricopeptide (TPR) repeat protein